MSTTNVLIYFVRRDMRVADNPILHQLASSPDHGFTHLLPVFVIPPHQIEVSGFVKDGATSPYPEARSEVGRYWRCGTHRVKFIAQSVWNMKENLARLGSGLIVRIGRHEEVLKTLIDGLAENDFKVGATWMIEEEGYEEGRDVKTVTKVCQDNDVDIRVWTDEKYFVDDRDVGLESPQELPDVFTTYRKIMEPLKEKPRATLPEPSQGSLPKWIDEESIPAQAEPFRIPSSLEQFVAGLMSPITAAIPKAVPPEEGKSAHPFTGGETHGLERLEFLVKSGNATSYKASRNGLLGTDFSTKLSAYLAQGCITARQVHAALEGFEDGKDERFSSTEGYGEGENEGTKAIRIELLWRDYMRLCTQKFKNKLFHRAGFRNEYTNKWKTANPSDPENNNKEQTAEEIGKIVNRVMEGTTGHSLIDASQRELIFSGYTSNRARQNVASFLAKHLGIDWRYGAEWYEMFLVDYDVSSNWANWQYVAGVGNDPRGEARIFNPVKQAFDYDKDGDYVRTWVPEIREIEKLEHLFQPWTTPKEDWERFGLNGVPMAEDPLKKIEFSVEGKPKTSRRPYARRRGQGRGGGAPAQAPQGPSNPQQGPGDPNAAYGQRRPYPTNDGSGHLRGGYRGNRGYNGGYRGRGYGPPRGGYRGGGGPPVGGPGRGGHWQTGHHQVPRPMQPWSQPEPAQ
ncbi:DASH family cryptochrome [Xylariomycetidae sp. FL0641]|nr:DASH family cryptochrome [Xylariomycetidae sp. FL0641]